MRHAAFFRQSSALYLAVVLIWATLFLGAAVGLWRRNADAISASPVDLSLLVVVIVFVGYFWLNGTKDVLYLTWYYGVLRRRPQRLPPSAVDRPDVDVVLVYCTRNDFNGDALDRSMGQTHHTCRTVILDDSDQADWRSRVDAFARARGIEVVRRLDRAGFKAGNLNHYLSRATFDYVVILDSDEIIPDTFVTRALDYFTVDSRVGIVQANHISTRNSTPFQQLFSRGVDSHWPVYQSVKSRYGFMSLLGHGAMVSRACYDAAGGFPHVVAEDVAFSLVAREARYLTVFAPDILCEEEYPPDYLAFRKRHGKWTEGNLEFIRRSTWPILVSRRLHWFEKLDVVLFTYGLPLTAVFTAFIILNVAVLPLRGVTFVFPPWMLAPTVAFLLAPMANDVIYHWRTTNKRRLLAYSLGSTVLYGGMFFTSLRSSARSLRKGSTFHVTPRNASSMSLRDAVRATYGEWVFASVLSVTSALLLRSVLPVFLIVLPALGSVYLAVFHQGRPSDESLSAPMSSPN